VWGPRLGPVSEGATVVALIDLSVPVSPAGSEATPVRVIPVAHRDAPGLVGLSPEDFPDGMGVSTEVVELTTHTGTHLDAPLHYGPASGGRPARSVAEVPLEWCIGDGVRLDLRHRGPGEAIGAEDVRLAAEHAGGVNPGDIVLIWTGCDRLWGTPAYLTDHPGLTAGAVGTRVEEGVLVIGIDAWGLDRPIPCMVDDYRRTRDPGVLWPAHLYGRRREYCQLEKLTNLGRLPGPRGFRIACFPVKVEGAGAGWARVVAMVEP
jgi:kynurenine formamidase